MIEEYRECRVCRRTKHIDRFYEAKNRQGKTYRRRVCTACYHRKRERKRVPLTKMRPYVRQIVLHCGSIRAAADYLGTSPMVVRRWLGLSPRYDNGKQYRDQRMNKDTAAHVLNALRELRRAA